MEAYGTSDQGRSWGCRPTSPRGFREGTPLLTQLPLGVGLGSLGTVGSLTFCWLVHIAGSSSPGPPLGEQ